MRCRYNKKRNKKPRKYEIEKENNMAIIIGTEKPQNKRGGI